MPFAPLALFTPRVRRVLLALAGLTISLMLLAWLALPHWLRQMAEQEGSAALGRRVTIGAVHVNPLRLSVQVDDLTIAGATDAAPPLFHLSQGLVNADVRSLWRRAPVVEAVELQGPSLHLARLSDGHYDIDDVLARLRPEQPAAPDAPPSRFALYNLRIVDGQAHIDDRPRGRVHEVKALQLGLPFLSNLDDALEVNVEPRVAFELDGTGFDTGAQAKPFSKEREGVLTLKSGAVDLAAWLPYLPADLPLRPASGQVRADLSLHFKAPAGKRAVVILRGSLRVDGLRVVDASNAAMADLARGELALNDVQPLRRQVALGAVRIEGLGVSVQRDAQGRLNWLQALGRLAGAETPPAAASASPPVSAASGAPTAPEATDWQVSVAQVALQDSRVQWQDAAVRPAAALALQAVQLTVDGLRWPLLAEQPAARLQAAAQLVNLANLTHLATAAEPAKPAGRPPSKLPNKPAAAPAAAAPASAPELSLLGEWSAAGGQLQAKAVAWPVDWAAPYLAEHLVPRVAGRLAFDATGRWSGVPGTAPPTLQLSDFQLSDVKVTVAGAARPAAAWKLLQISDLVLDTTSRQLSVGRLQWDQPSLAAQRDQAGQIDWAAWLKADAVAAPPAEAPREAPPWRASLQEAAIDGARLAWRDAATGSEHPAAVELQRLRLSAQGLQWPPAPNARVKLQGSAQVVAPDADMPAAPGNLSWRGELGLAPLAWKGQVKAERFPVHALAAYAGAQLPVTVARADVGWQGPVEARFPPEGPVLALQGDARVTDLRLYGREGGAAGDELLSWQALDLPAVKISQSPGRRPQVDIGLARLSDFYARLMVGETGHFNLTDLNAPGAAASAPDAAVPPASSAPLAAVPASAPAVDEALPLDLAVAGVQLRNGRVDFSDRFIKPNYNAALSDLNGALGAFRTGTRDMATLELHGRVAGTALLEVRGALNPTARPLALDVQARATDLELAPLSPYAGKYAGYAIERGKLSMDVSYRIDADGRLDAKNQIVLNQLTFGDRIDSPDATKLPVLLAVALLKDRNGIIDVNLPIGGSLNDPQFSVGGLIIKVILNLLGKALTAPFALLAGGGDEDLSLVEFTPGTAQPAANAGPAIDRVAKALADRPALQMTVTGAADPQSEREAMQGAWLEERLLAEQRKDRLRASAAAAEPAGSATTAAAPAAPVGEERSRLVKRLYAETKLPNKPRNALGLAKDIPVAEMEALLRASHLVTDDTTRELALQRGLAVRDALIAKGLPSERLFLAAPKLRISGEDDASWTPRVQLSLATH